MNPATNTIVTPTTYMRGIGPFQYISGESNIHLYIALVITALITGLAATLIACDNNGKNKDRQASRSAAITFIAIIAIVTGIMSLCNGRTLVNLREVEKQYGVTFTIQTDDVNNASWTYPGGLNAMRADNSDIVIPKSGKLNRHVGFRDGKTQYMGYLNVNGDKTTLTTQSKESRVKVKSDADKYDESYDTQIKPKHATAVDDGIKTPITKATGLNSTYAVEHTLIVGIMTLMAIALIAMLVKCLIDKSKNDGSSTVETQNEKTDEVKAKTKVKTPMITAICTILVLGGLVAFLNGRTTDILDTSKVEQAYGVSFDNTNENQMLPDPYASDESINIMNHRTIRRNVSFHDNRYSYSGFLEINRDTVHLTYWNKSPLPGNLKYGTPMPTQKETK